MLNFQDQLAVLNLRERILNDAALRKRILNMLGEQKGWRELADELHYDYKVLRAIADLSVCDLTCSSREIAAARAALNLSAKNAILERKTKRPSIILNGQSIPMTLTIVAKHPVTIVTAKNNKVFRQVCCRRKRREEVQLRHDYNVPLYIYGDMESLTCTNQKLTECYLLRCPRLTAIDLSQNKLPAIDVRSEVPLLLSIRLRDNPCTADALRAMVNQLPIYEPNLLFLPTITLGSSPFENIHWLAHQRGWTIE